MWTQCAIRWATRHKNGNLDLLLGTCPPHTSSQWAGKQGVFGLHQPERAYDPPFQ
jgi:hypothetical protein